MFWKGVSATISLWLTSWKEGLSVLPLMGLSSHFGEVVKACYSKSRAHPCCSQQGRPSYFQFMKSHFGILYRSEHHICAYNVSVSVLNCLLIPLEGSDIQKRTSRYLAYCLLNCWVRPFPSQSLWPLQLNLLFLI